MLKNEAAEDSLQNKIKASNARTAELDGSESKLFPLGANLSSAKYDIMRRDNKPQQFKLADEDYEDFRVPMQIVLDYSEVMRPFRP